MKNVEEMVIFGCAYIQKKIEIMEAKDWTDIDSLIQNIIICNNGAASAGFETNLNKKLQEICDNQKTVGELKKLAELKP